MVLGDQEGVWKTWNAEEASRSRGLEGAWKSLEE